MFSVKNWSAQASGLDQVQWDEYKYIPSATMLDMCILSLGVNPAFGLKYLNYQESRKSQYQLFIHSCIAGESSFNSKEMRVFKRIAQQVGLTDLPSIPDESDLGFIIYCGYYARDFKSALFEKLNKIAFIDILIQYAPIDQNIMRVYQDVYTEAFISSFRKRYLIIQKNLMAKKLNSFRLAGDEDKVEIEFSEFAEWANSICLELPEGFPEQKVAEESEFISSFPPIKQPERMTDQWLFAEAIIKSYRKTTKKAGTGGEILAWIKQGHAVAGGYGDVRFDDGKIISKSIRIDAKTLSNALK